MTRWLFFLLLIISNSSLLSQTRLKHDSNYITLRKFDNAALQELKKDRNFQYNRTREPTDSLWDKFWKWFWWKIGQLLGTRQGRVTFWSILVVFGIAAIMYFIVRITGMDRNGLFGRSSSGLQKYSLSQDDIHKISFDDEIANAVNTGNYRLAIRLLYLQALKKLSDKGHIDWRINKTNTDYLAETTGKPFNKTFRGLTFDFEYTWYGERQVSKEQYLEIAGQFQQFNNQV